MQNQQNLQIPQQPIQHPTPYFTQEPLQSVIQKSVQQPAPFFTHKQYQQIVQLLNKGMEEGTSCKTTATCTPIALLYQFVKNRWIIDTRASNHMTSSLQLLKSCQLVLEFERYKVHLPIREVVLVTHRGKLSVFTNQDISDVLYVYLISNTTCFQYLNLPRSYSVQLHSSLTSVSFKISIVVR